MMNKKFLLIGLLYLVAPVQKIVSKAAEDPIVLEITGLSAMDHAGIVNVGKIAEFRSKVDRLLNKVITIKGVDYTLEDFVGMVEAGTLSKEQEMKLFEKYVKVFLELSHTYFIAVSHLKPVLVKILSIWAHQRNRTDSLILLWATIENGKEEQFVRDYTPTLKSFYDFLKDIDMLLLDIMNSCPKSYAQYLECKKIVEEGHQHNK